jgi:hypothetical protein
MKNKQTVKYVVVALLFGGVPLAGFLWRANQLHREGTLYEQGALLAIYLLVGTLAYIRFSRNRY